MENIIFEYKISKVSVNNKNTKNKSTCSKVF